MQIPYCTGTDLANYYEMSRRGQWELPCFKERCPICGGRDCAVLHSYYTRRVLAPELGLDVHDFRIYRFLCRGKGSRRVSEDRTFSLLLTQLVPYRRISLVFMVVAVLEYLMAGLSLWAVTTRIEQRFVCGEMFTPFLYPASILAWRSILYSGVQRLVMVGPERLGIVIGEGSTLDQQLQAVFADISCVNTEEEIRIRGPDTLAWRYHQLLHGERGGGHFLFGTPSQERGRR